MLRATMRIATWNVDRPKPGGWKVPPAQLDRMSEVNADVWVLTETHLKHQPSDTQVHALFSPPHLERRPEHERCAANPDVPLVVAGDFNQSRDGSDWYGTKKTRDYLDRALSIAGLICVTEDDMVATKLLKRHHLVDHICFTPSIAERAAVSCWQNTAADANGSLTTRSLPSTSCSRPSFSWLEPARGRLHQRVPPRLPSCAKTGTCLAPEKAGGGRLWRPVERPCTGQSTGRVYGADSEFRDTVSVGPATGRDS